jgi:hypothetical protein
MLADFEKVLDRLDGLELKGEDKAMALCPAHDDKNPSLSLKVEDGRLLLKCFAGCSVEEIVAVLDVELSNLFAEGGEAGGETVPFKPSSNRSTVSSVREGVKKNKNLTTGKETGEETFISLTPPENTETLKHLTLAEYADAKRLPEEFLRSLGLSDKNYNGKAAVRIPYPGEHGEEAAVRYRTSLHGSDKFRWRKGDKPFLYGLPLLDKARDAGYVVLVEGESDCHSLWFHEIPALGIPGANNWKNEWSSHLDGIGKVYLVVEPDAGGDALREKLTASGVRDRLYLIELDGVKDASELHLQDPERFRERFAEALENAVSYMDIAQTEVQERARAAWERCEGLANEPDILHRFARELARSGVAGEERIARLLYLAVTSRLLQKPVSVAVKGPSSGGKSYLTERVLDYFPETAYYALTSMSEHALAYSEEPLSHRFLVIYEASGMEGDMQTYLIRSLLSEGCLRYETVEKTSEGIKARLIEREGPTGLIVTTTATRLHPENETRLLSLTVTDTRKQTADILMALAKETAEEPDLEPWLALQTWLEGAGHDIEIPYAGDLAGMVPPVAVRLRRDFGAVLNLIRAHAVLHQATRLKDADGRIEATFEDYESVRELVVELVSAGVESTVPAIVRETVEVVGRLLDETGKESVTSREVGEELELERGPVSRRVRLAVDAGYLKNLEDRKGRPYRLVLGDDMPEDLEILPNVEDLKERFFGTGERNVSGFVNAGRPAAA